MKAVRGVSSVLQDITLHLELANVQGVIRAVIKIRVDPLSASSAMQGAIQRSRVVGAVRCVLQDITLHLALANVQGVIKAVIKIRVDPLSASSAMQGAIQRSRVVGAVRCVLQDTTLQLRVAVFVQLVQQAVTRLIALLRNVRSVDQVRVQKLKSETLSKSILNLTNSL